ncbi:hypothetical protein J6590_104171 [Homalodisca vitripennis]|nr:hypothetical protein J6590_104171 [Homalodisca vitripennis]
MPRKQNCIACLYAERVLAHSERLQTSDATPDFGPDEYSLYDLTCLLNPLLPGTALGHFPELSASPI